MVTFPTAARPVFSTRSHASLTMFLSIYYDHTRFNNNRRRDDEILVIIDASDSNYRRVHRGYRMPPQEVYIILSLCQEGGTLLASDAVG
jgi:hypothetical protein